MFRTPDIPQPPEKEFSDKDYQEELLWLERKKNGKVLSSQTDGGWLLAVGSALLIAFIIGGVFGTLVALITRSNLGLIFPVVVIFLVALYFLKGDFAVVEIDPERKLLFYEGTLSIGGEYRSTRFRGPIEVVESTLLVRFPHLLFKSKPYIRFMTSSGYMRVNFKPEKEKEFLEALEILGLVNINSMNEALQKKPIRVEDKYIVYFQKNFDRTKFKEKLKQKREAEKHQEKIDKKIRRKQLIEKSKKFQATNNSNETYQSDQDD